LPFSPPPIFGHEEWLTLTAPLRIIVTGLVGLYPVGGVAWDYLQYVVGLARLGHDVYYHEDTRCWPYQPRECTYTGEGHYSAQYIDSFFARYAPELRERWHYLHLNETSFGMRRASFDAVARTANLFLNISGACMIPEELSPECRTVFVDTDPGYNQIALSERPISSEKVDRWSARGHDRHFTYAENIHGDDCRVPKLGFAWKTTRMPIVLSLWTSIVNDAPVPTAPWTTVMTWNPFKRKLVYEGVEYTGKDTEFEKIMELPAQVTVPLKVAVGGLHAPLERLTTASWQVLDAPSTTVSPEDYQAFIAESRGEISPAKQVYVAMRTGWFSCRSACYLAAGRPVIVQDTGFAAALPVGEGIVPFSTLTDAMEALQEVEQNYARHAEAASAIAREYFEADAVLTRLVEEALSRNDA
jgi:hypothetical protein